MIFYLPQLISYISNYVTLNRGDMLLTGTPSGVGAIKPGDYIEAYISQD